MKTRRHVNLVIVTMVAAAADAPRVVATALPV